MTLPVDFNTSLWLSWIPVWEWQPLPPCGDGTPAGDTGPSADTPAPGDASPSMATLAPLALPEPKPGQSAQGHRLVFKGFEIAGHVVWYPADGPLSRPWVADVADAADRNGHRRTPAHGRACHDPALPQDDAPGTD